MDFGIWFSFVGFVYHKMDKEVKGREGGREERRKRGKEETEQRKRKRKEGRGRERERSLHNQKPWVNPWSSVSVLEHFHSDGISFTLSHFYHISKNDFALLIKIYIKNSHFLSLSFSSVKTRGYFCRFQTVPLCTDSCEMAGISYIHSGLYFTIYSGC